MDDLLFARRGGALCASIRAELDQHNSARLRERIDGEIMRSLPSRLILDLSGVDFMDSSGVGLLIGRYKRLSEIGGRLLVCGLSPSLRVLFDMAGLGKIITAYDSLEQAVSNLAEGA
ncbi:MAG: anti-sigma factor antagonist [Clostridiales bacterium]|nr:anti-sigma factor antagonist [Clostridiales bacterium]